MNLGNFLFDKLPNYFKKEDSYKDSEDKGLLERYCASFGEDFDEVLIPLIADYIKTLNPIESKDFMNNILEPGISDDSKYLPLIAEQLGNPPHLGLEDSEYRLLLSFVATLYRWRGTKKSIQLWGQVLGLDLEIIELQNPVFKYDKELSYDKEEPISEIETALPKYDTNCGTCSDYYLVVENAIFIE